MPTAPQIPLSEITWSGEGLKRPECVITTAKGEVFAGDHHCGITELGKPKKELIGAPPGFLPNGVTMLPNREFLIANLGPGGGVWRLDKDWRLWPWLFEAEGEPLRVCNFVGYERDGTVYISVSTRHFPRERSMRPVIADGFIVRVTPRAPALSPTALPSPTNAASTRRANGSTSTRHKAGAFPASRSAAIISAPKKPSTSSAPASFPMASPSTRKAARGWPACLPIVSSASTPRARLT